jgi:hypothetical protein
VRGDQVGQHLHSQADRRAADEMLAACGAPGSGQHGAFGVLGLGWRHDMAEQRAIGLVEGDGIGHPIGKVTRRAVAEAGEQGGAVGRGPAAAHREPARGGPVAEGYHGGEAPRMAPGDDRLVMVQHGDGEQAGFRLDPTPFDREAIGVEPDRARQIEILRP